MQPELRMAGIEQPGRKHRKLVLSVLPQRDTEECGRETYFSW